MACFRPLLAHQDARDGEVKLGVGLRDSTSLELPCGRCIGCRMDRSHSWAIRIMHEAQLHPRNRFVTLDYAPEHLRSWSLNYPDFQGFMKRLRRRVPGFGEAPDGRRPIRFFVAGEYGERFKRPHFHAILFNCQFPDEQVFYNGTRRSSLCEELWQRGNAVLGEVTPESAAYVAGYTLNKRYGKEAEDFYEDLVNPLTGEVSSRRPEFVVMSRRPGVGAGWYDRFRGDLFPHDFAVMQGRQYKVPRYYLEKYKKSHPMEVEQLLQNRYLKSRERPEESSPERRAVREEYHRKRAESFKERNH